MEFILNLMVLFISVSILLFLGTQILGSDSLGDCTDLDGYDAKGKSSNSTQWSKQCYDIQETTIDAYGLFGVVLIVISAIAILALVRVM